MRYGIVSGILWGLATVMVGIAMTHAPLAAAIGMAAAISGAFIHDAASAGWLCLYMGLRRRLRKTITAISTAAGRKVMLAALLGGPVGTAGYVMAIDSLGPAHTAIISGFYPAFGALAARILLRESLEWYQYIALLIAIGGVIGIGYTSATSGDGNPTTWGFIGAAACVIGWGSEAVLSAWAMREEHVDNEVALHIRELTSAIVFAIILLPLARAGNLTLAALSTPAGWIVVAAAFVGTASYLFYYKAIVCVGAARGMSANITYTVWAVMWTALLLGVTPSVGELICCCAVFIGAIGTARRWRFLSRTSIEAAN